jgi:hypothetical protein
MSDEFRVDIIGGKSADFLNRVMHAFNAKPTTSPALTNVLSDLTVT